MDVGRTSETALGTHFSGPGLRLNMTASDRVNVACVIAKKRLSLKSQKKWPKMQ